MDIRKIFIIFFICFFIHVMVLKSDKMTEDLKLKKRFLNKPAVKIIKTKYGETYGCVDFYKQPAFDHPLLRNHSFHPQMRPSVYPNNTKFEESNTKTTSSSIWLNGKGCPIGTVPIRRINKDHIFTSTFYSKSEENRIHYAVIRTKSNSGMRYHGGGAVFEIQNPPVLPFQYSACQLQVKEGNEVLKVGWMVNPVLYRDNHTHLFTFTSAIGTHCYNTVCPGIISLDPHEPIDQVLEPVTVRGGEIYDIRLYIYKDPIDGNWWLKVGEQNKLIAVWPKNILQGLAESAGGVEWGGQTYSMKGLPSPPMGFDDFPTGNYYFDAFGKEVSVMNEEYQTLNAPDTETFTDSNRYYDVIDKGIDETAGHWFVFGGPGGIKD